MATADPTLLETVRPTVASNLEPVSLAPSNQSENRTSTGSEEEDEGVYEGEEERYRAGEDVQKEPPIRCSAVHTLERDMPDFDYSDKVAELRRLILDHARENPGLFCHADVDKCAHDDWYLSRFLLRHKLDLEAAFDMLKDAMRFNNESLTNSLRPQDFPAEFYEVGGLFPYGEDRKGSKMLYMRVKKHKKTPEILVIIHAFVYYHIKRLDEKAQGKGISVVIDCQGGGLANADMDTLLFIISTLKNYFPKGLSYLLIHEIPWILKPFWHIAKNWIPDENRDLVKFSSASTIQEYVDLDNLPPYLGGTGLYECNPVPENCTTIEQAAKLWGIERQIVKRVFNKFKADLPEKTTERVERWLSEDLDH